MQPFLGKLKKEKQDVVRKKISTLQINVGKVCNQACLHCHVEAGPKRTEAMTRKTAEKVVEWMQMLPHLETVDITGGAPEINPNFRFLVKSARRLGLKVIDRCNLTILLLPTQKDTAQFLAEQSVEIISSLPCYLAENVDRQRGRHVFEKSILALQMLNSLGYGQGGSKLMLNLVYNPVGAHLPPDQATLEQDYKTHLFDKYGIVFNQLFVLTNMPIGRFTHALKREGQLASYMQLLSESFNPATVANLMCTSQISVGYDGALYDCDFNQMIELPIGGKKKTIFEINAFDEKEFSGIALGNHCYGCTAGSGSSCGGAII